MCRIAGLINFELPASVNKRTVENMCALQKHGGPDDGGIYISENQQLVLGNRRLSLLDLTADGHMPMVYQNRFFITYNGEIYNYKAIKSELIVLGHHFSNQTDTEVILAAFAQWGPLAFNRLKGMFAFALYDQQENELYLVRDTAGIKPLYYASNTTGIIFASEVRAFQAAEVKPLNNESWPIYLLAYGHIPEPISTLKNVQSLPKGFYLKYELGTKSISLQSFAHYSFSNRIFDATEANQRVAQQLEMAVEQHLLADAPIGVFLSGGLDSGIIAALASKYKQTALNSLSIYFEEKEYSEKQYQDILINHLNCNAHQLLLNETEFNQSFPSILNDMDMPSCDGINTWFISKYAATNGLKAVLSGVGGDELFGGYPSFNRMGKAILLQHLPNFIKQAGKKSKFKRLSRMSYLQLDGLKGLYLFLRGNFTPNDIAQQLGAYENDVWNTLNDMPTLQEMPCLDDKNKASWVEFNMYMQNQLLRDSDVMSMIHGVEIRVPFLDDEVIRLANSIQPETKYAGALPKQFLIDAFWDDIPQAIWDRPKMGFSFPFAKWLSNSAYVKELMVNGNEQSNKNFQNFVNGKMHWSHMMSLVILNHRNAI
jgi:asparagine synthase (glutamine-hydrolysing)